ncbi:MAG TPA: von Willebrand factor type A domain-containing protein [Chitinophagaceae bacterium]|nr:von Willebrand factor type A domain-containing protein [Chitinophagaceae bacterium]
MRKIIWLIAPLSILIVAFRSFTTHTITGLITDQSGAGVSNASVIVKGSKLGVTADVNGRYSINADSKNATLVFSAVGFSTQEIESKGRSVINIILKTSSAAVHEVVVTGIDIARKKDANYSLGDMPAQRIQGYVPGLSVNTTSAIYNQDFNTEDYDGIAENGFHKATDDPLSTFSIDVDAASYSNVRRFLNNGQLPPAGAVRIEEMINYFRYNYPQPVDKHPFSITTELSACPWNTNHKLALIGLQGKQIPTKNLPPSNLVFLIDVSGSMNGPLRLPLVQSSLKLLVDQLREEDKISIVVYAGAAGLVLPPTSGANKIKIKNAIDQLQAGGSTAGGAGIRLAYQTAKQNFIEEGNNRVILCTDGDFNVGVSSDDELERMIEKERESGVYLTVLGYGMGNYKDNKMQKLADKGNGNHAYIDGMNEAKKVLVNEFGGTLFTIAKDVKLQIEFNPAKVAGYRLIGYENRMLKKEDFNDDKKDAGELGSGHTVTALYEIIPAGVESEFLKDIDPLKYSKEKSITSSHTNELLTVKFRYKTPTLQKSELIAHPVIDNQIAFSSTSDNFRFAASVAEFGMLLRNSEFKSQSSFVHVLKIAGGAKGRDAEGYRKEFLELVKKAQALNNGDDVVVNE